MFAASKTASVSGGYQISRSLRFNSADSAYLNRTPASATNRKTWTWSGWVKRSTLIASGGTPQNIFGARDGNYTLLRFNYFADPGNTIRLEDSGFSMITLPVYRDVSAWYHIVLAVDTTQATNTNRVKLYVNNVLQTFDGTYTSYPTQNYDTQVNNNIAHNIGAQPTYGDYFNGYITEVNFIDGSQLTPSSFGETNAQTGVWQPKAYSGSYGTNGFYLNFSDNSNTTAATLGKDYSGNGNNWTPNNFSVTAGAGNDSLVDSPTSYGTDTGVGGTVRGNYCTLNPVDNGGATVTNGNLDWDSASNQGTRASFYASTGKWYWEITSTEANLIGEHGVAPASKSLTGGDAWPGSATGGWGFSNNSGNKSFNGTQTNITSAGTNGDVMMYALDMDAGKIWFGRNGTWFSSGNPASGTNEAFSGLTGTLSPMTGVGGAAAGSVSYNFGQRPFAYTAPSGYKALCTQNLPTPTIGATTATQAGKYFNTVLYTGTDSAQTITGVGFQPDYVWLKNRTAANAPKNLDVLRGAGWSLSSAETGAEANQTNAFTAFTSDGFSVATNGGEYNASGRNYVAWNWKANGSGSTNTAGSITSTVSANTTSGFSVVTYTGTSTNATVGHGLGAVPAMIIVKVRNTTDGWFVYNKEIGNTKYLRLNTTDAAATFNLWQNTTPTSSVFSIATDPTVNGSGNTYVAYCFAEVAGYSKFGSYTGNGSSDGVFVYTGFRPAYVLIKRTTSAYNWWILDAARGTINAVKGRLYADAADAESTTYPYVDFLSNGFKLRDADGGNNASGEPYIYACFASAPFKYSLAR